MMKKIVCTLFFLALCCGAGYAQQPEVPNCTQIPDAKVDSVRDYIYKMYSADAELYLKTQQYNQMYFEYQKRYIDHNYVRFQQQASKSDIIFWMVLFVVFSGIAFSFIQFYIGLRKHEVKAAKMMQQVYAAVASDAAAAPATGATPLAATPVAPATSDDKDPVTTMKIGKDGIEITSSIMGVIILVISIVFFYLYLTIVYPINSIDGSPASKNDAKKAADK